MQSFQEVDFLGSLVTLSPERLAVMDYSEYIFIDEMTAIYKRPGIVPDMVGFVKPYPAEVSGQNAWSRLQFGDINWRR